MTSLNQFNPLKQDSMNKRELWDGFTKTPVDIIELQKVPGNQLQVSAGNEGMQMRKAQGILQADVLSPPKSVSRKSVLLRWLMSPHFFMIHLSRLDK